MTHSRQLLIATIVVVTIVIAVAVVRSLRRANTFTRRDSLLVDDPATPRAREAVENLHTITSEIACAGSRLQTDNKNLMTAVKGLVKTMSAVAANISSMPPAYDNYVSLYRSLSGSSDILQDAAKRYTSLGQNENQKIAQGAPDPEGEIANSAETLLSLGRLTRGAVTAVHILGAALDLE